MYTAESRKSSSQPSSRFCLSLNVLQRHEYNYVPSQPHNWHVFCEPYKHLLKINLRPHCRYLMILKSHITFPHGIALGNFQFKVIGFQLENI